MVRVSFVLIPPGMEDIYKKVIKPNDRFSFSSVRRKALFTSRKRKKTLTLYSLFVPASAEWNTLSPTVQNDWKTAGLASNYTGFQCFLRDYASRKRNNLTTPGTANNFVQNNCLRCTISSPATAIKLAQEHPFAYYVQRKVTGTRNQFKPVLVTESFGMPVELKFRAHSALTSAGANPYARVYLEIYSNYQGRDIITNLTISVSLVSGWALYSDTLNQAIGTVRGYNAYIDLHDVQGTFEIDNIAINHSAQNWCRDPRCDKSAVSFTRAFYQIARNWVGIDLPIGSYYDSIYYEL